MDERAMLRLGLVCLLGIALAGCGTNRRGDGGPAVVVDAGSVSSGGGDGGGTDPGTLGSGVPDEAASDCGCDAPASDDGSSDAGDGTDSGGGADSGGLGDGSDGGDGSGDLRAPPLQGHWLTAPGPGGAVSPPCIHGLIEDDRGRPIPGAAVSAALEGPDAETATTTGQKGHFCLKGALTGTAAVTVSAPDGSQVKLVHAATQALDAHGCVPVRAVLPAQR